MAASSDLVSVVIPAYNAERWIPQTLATVRAQTHRELEVIVVDDGSTDRTAEVAADALAGFHGRVEIVRQDNKGLPATRNVGFRASRGRWVHFMDADDLVTPDMIALLHREAVRDPDAAVVYGPYCRLFDDESGRPPSPGATYVPDVDPAAPASLLHAIVLIQASLIHREWFEVIGGFNGELRYVAEDRDFLIRMAVAGGRFIRASAHDPVCLWRMHPGIPRVGGSEAKYRASESMFVWMMSLKRCVGPGTLKDCCLRPADEAGIIGNTRFLLRKLLDNRMYDEFDRYVSEFRQMAPDFVPRRPVARWALSKVVGYEAAAVAHRTVSKPFRRPPRPGSECRYKMSSTMLMPGRQPAGVGQPVPAEGRPSAATGVPTGS